MFRSCKCFMMIITYVFAFEWIKDNDHLDCVVAIGHRNGEFISTGVQVGYNLVLTSANPVEDEDINNIAQFRVFHTFNQQRFARARAISRNQCNRRNNSVWVGYDTSHSPIHDIALIHIDPIGAKWVRFFNESSSTFRTVFRSTFATNKSIYSPEIGWYFSGFGFVDEKDVNDSKYLDVEYLDKSTQTDCDEWIPREWGHFLCFYDFNNLAGVPSGAPLFQATDFIPGRTPVFGIGSFSLTKNEETILVFTDIRKYAHKLHGDGYVRYDYNY